MKIRLIEGIAGADQCYAPGTEVDWPDHVAIRYVRGGLAVQLDADASLETATVTEDRTAKVKLTRYTGKGKAETR